MINFLILEDKELLDTMESNIISLIDFFKELLNHSEEIHLHKNKLECDMQNMQSCLLDELQRESNKQVYKNAIQTITDATDSCKVFIKVHQGFSKQLLTFTSIDC